MTSERAYTVLVVEDNSDSREMLCSVLRHNGHNVIEAENGKRAISEASYKHPDLIVMDLAMPEMDGVEAARQILQMPGLADTPIFAVSGFATSDVKADVLAAGCIEFLEKPIDLRVLLQKIKGALNAIPLLEIQRREVERLQVYIPAHWGVTWQCQHDGTITSLSTKGCLVQTNLVETLSGAPIFLRFLPSTERWMSLRGKVLYYLREVGFGVEFTELTGEDEATLKKLGQHYSGKRA
ncbi:MAG: response regulator [Pyrinomonadaceae bacterium]|nr:response regulator [Pyrinomonadaceae bacterium]